MEDDSEDYEFQIANLGFGTIDLDLKSVISEEILEQNSHPEVHSYGYCDSEDEFERQICSMGFWPINFIF